MSKKTKIGILSKKKIFFGLSLVPFVFIGAAALADSFAGPSAAPPNGNAFVPINTSSSTQTKDGDLGVLGNVSVGGNFIANGFSYFKNKVGINIDTTANPTH